MSTLRRYPHCPMKARSLTWGSIMAYSFESKPTPSPLEDLRLLVYLLLDPPGFTVSIICVAYQFSLNVLTIGHLFYIPGFVVASLATFLGLRLLGLAPLHGRLWQEAFAILTPLAVYAVIALLAQDYIPGNWDWKTRSIYAAFVVMVTCLYGLFFQARSQNRGSNGHG